MIVTLKLASIRIDGDTQLRVEANQDVIQRYAQDMCDGDMFPPVVVFTDGVNLWLSDGFHRFFATQEAGKNEIQADVRQGSRRDALLHAVEANRKHGLPMGNNDKRRMVTLFLNDPEWAKWSDREIARRCGVSHPFVSSLRSSLESVTSERTYITKYGTVATMNVTKIATMNVTRIGNDPYEGLSEYVIDELERRDASPEDIAEIARYARDVQSDIKGNACKALLVGSWMLGCKEGNTPRIGDPPYTQEQMEKEGWVVWRLIPQDLKTALNIGSIERKLHEEEEAKGKEFFEITGEDMLANCATKDVEALAQWYMTIHFRCCDTIWHYLTFNLSQEAKEKMTNGEIKTLAEAHEYDREQRAQRDKEFFARWKAAQSEHTADQVEMQQAG